MTDLTNKRAPVSSRGANRNNLDPATEFTEKGPQQPRTERTRRRAAQAENAATAKVEAQRPGPTKAEKAEHAAKVKAEAAKPKDPTARGSARKQAQAKHREQAKVEASTLAAAPDPIFADLVPGEQPSLLQLRRLNKLQTRKVRNEATEAGKAAGKAVRDILVGRKLRATPHQRHARVAAQQDALQKAGANTSQ